MQFLSEINFPFHLFQEAEHFLEKVVSAFSFLYPAINNKITTLGGLFKTN